jgi:hypothetical protein
MPVEASAKSLASTPVTDSLNVTVQETLVALVGDEMSRLIEETLGGVLSIVYAWPVKVPLSVFPAASLTPTPLV